jgi:hypothetical protein
MKVAATMTDAMPVKNRRSLCRRLCGAAIVATLIPSRRFDGLV